MNALLKPMLAIGVTGHRFLAETEKISAGIDQALERIEQVYPGRPWVMLSSLAEGADRLVVRQGLQHQPGTHLVVPLPLEVQDYLQDFATAESKNDFAGLLSLASEVIPAPAAASRTQAYQQAGCFVVEHSEVLIALWDGQPAQGTGGTAEMVALALHHHLPVYWVHCGNGSPGTDQPLSLGNGQGLLTILE